MSNQTDIDDSRFAQLKRRNWSKDEDRLLEPFIDMKELQPEDFDGLLPHRSFDACRRRVSYLRERFGRKRKCGRQPRDEEEGDLDRISIIGSRRLLAALQRANFYERPGARPAAR